MFSSFALDILWSSEIGSVAILCGLLPLIVQTFNDAYYLGHRISKIILESNLNIKNILIVCFMLNILVLVLGLIGGERVNMINILLVLVVFSYLFYKVVVLIQLLHDQSSIHELIRIKMLHAVNDVEYKTNKQYFDDLLANIVKYAHRDYYDVKGVISFFVDTNKPYLIAKYIEAVYKIGELSIEQITNLAINGVNAANPDAFTDENCTSTFIRLQNKILFNSKFIAFICDENNNRVAKLNSLDYQKFIVLIVKSFQVQNQQGLNYLLERCNLVKDS